MKTAKYLIALALGSLAASGAQADDQWSVGVVVGNPYPPAYHAPPVYYAPPPVYLEPPPVVIYRHPQSHFYGVPAVTYPAPAPGFIQFSYGNGGYGGYNYGPRNFQGGHWGRGRGHHHHR